MKKMIFKYVKQLQKSTFYPSEINFLNEAEFKIDDDLLLELNAKIDTMSKDQYPKLQITQKNGYWFALNNTMLFLFQNLEQKKRVDKVNCEIISLDKVPIYLQKEMVLNFDYRTSESSGSESCCSACYGNTVTTIVSGDNGQNQVPGAKSKCCSDSDEPTEQSYRTSLIASNDNLSDSFSSSSDLSDYNRKDPSSNFSLSCNYCNQNFSNTKLLRKHKLRKKHFVCTVCGERFKNLTRLERHKQGSEHWSDDDS